MAESLFLSIKVALLATFVVALLGITVASFLAQHHFKGKGLVESMLLLPMILPPTVMGYYLVILLGRYGLVGKPLYDWTGWSIMFTWQAAVVASAVVSFPIMVRTAQSAIESVDREMINSSIMLGYSHFETTLRVTLPLAWPGILAGVILSFTRAIGEFGATIMLAGNIPGRTDTMPLAIYSYASAGEWDRANALVLVLTLFSILLLLLSRRISRSMF